MGLSKALRKIVEKARESDAFWVEKAKLDFAMALERQRLAVGMSYSDLAKKIASSAAYMTKIFRGDSNMTIESMVKLSRATGGQLRIEIVPVAASAGDWSAKLKMVKASSVVSTVGVSTVVTLSDYQRGAANDTNLVAA